MTLNRQLILFRFILQQLGFEDFEDLRDEFSTKEIGVTATGYTHFANLLLANSLRKIDDQLIYQYDEAIQEYEKKLRDNRAEPFFSFKYYQWFALLFTEYYFDQLANDKEQFVLRLNEYQSQNSDFRGIETYTEKELKKIAYWMATGSGKTLLLHCNYWQINKYFKDWENIILITPNEGLSRQHYESLQESGIPAKLYSGSEESLKTKEGEVLVIEITKLVKDKTGDGVSVDVDYFSESKNLVFIDEGHKGSKSDEQTWKTLREYITRGEGSFTFEYSATFGQVITGSNKSFLLNEYARSILFDYSYRYFYTDGYGKDFTVFNIDSQNEYSEEQTRLLLTASMLGYYEQLALFEKYAKELRQYNIEKPLWVFVGSRVISNSGSLTQSDKQDVSDVTRVVHFFQDVLANPTKLTEDIQQILSGTSGLKNQEGDDIFEDKFEFVRKSKPVAENVLNAVFNGVGAIEAFQIKQADGELGLKTKASDKYFAVINIGDVSRYSKTLEEDTGDDFTVNDDSFTSSLFQSISETNSSVNILIGSKKFIEGWNSWRVSSMGLMNMGRSEGAQIIQLFGRGVRLKGKEYSLKREESTAPYHIKALQTISIFGLNASYMNKFLTEIEKEAPDYQEYPIEVKLNHEDQWTGQLMTFKKSEEANFKTQLFELITSTAIAKKVTVDLRNKISIASGGFNSHFAESSIEYQVNFLHGFMAFLDFNQLLVEVNRFKLLKGYTNLIISKDVLQDIIAEDNYNLYSNSGQFGIEEAINGKIQKVATSLLKDYVSKFYADKEKEYLSKHLTYEFLAYDSHKEMFPVEKRVIVKVPKAREAFIKELEESIIEMCEKDSKSLPSIHFDRHLYSPIASYEDGDKYKEIKTVPVRLNKGERDFLKHLRTFYASSDKLKGKKLFVLRNLSVKGLGFFMASSSFYPDFILWVVDDSKQQIYFLDPKGLLLGENHFNNPKIIWCKESAPAISQSIQEQLKKDNKQIEVEVNAFILSATSLSKLQSRWGDGTGVTKEEFAQNNVLFIEDGMEYLSTIFQSQ